MRDWNIDMTGFIQAKPVVTMDQVSFSHENGGCIFDQISLKVQEKKITAIMGPSGTGKTTLLKLIAGQLKPSAGTISVFDEPIHTLDDAHLYQLRKRMGMLFQQGGLFTHLNVYENVAFPLREHFILSESLLHDLVLLKLQMVGLRGAAHLMPSELSGGMARRVALARAIALDPALILYDEPFVGQDPISMGVLLNLISILNQALGLSSVIVSHDVDEVLKIADYVYVIADKKIIGEGTPASIAQTTSPQLKQFLSGEMQGSVNFDYPAKSPTQDFLGA